MSIKKILIIAFEFPPCQSAGVQRPTKFAEYLSTMGWDPIILTVKANAYKSTDSGYNPEASNMLVYRTSAKDSTKAFSIKGKYLTIMAAPDKWWTWALTAIPKGKAIIDEHKPDIILSTHPMITSHYIGWRLAKYAKIPWVADYRDPMKYHYDQSTVAYPFISRWIDRKVVKYASKLVFTTERTKQLYQKSFKDSSPNKFNVIENGYDEKNFALIDCVLKPANDARFKLLHSGAVFPAYARDPSALFAAISQLKCNNKINNRNFVLQFRGLPNGDRYKELLAELDIIDLVEFLPSVPYIDSLKEMKMADALLLLQGSLFNNQVPGKAYEYIRVGNPILAITDPTGATAELMSEIPYGYSAFEVKPILEHLKQILTKPNYADFSTEQYSRQWKTKELCGILDHLIAE